MDDQVVFHQFGEEFVFGDKIRQLPAGNMKTVRLQIRQHLPRIVEPTGGKFIIALPVSFKPACVQVQYIAGNVVFTQCGGDIAHLLFIIISAPAHP